MAYKTTHHFNFSHTEARDALVEHVRRSKNTAPMPDDNNSVQLIVLGGELILVWETRAENKPAWLPGTDLKTGK